MKFGVVIAAAGQGKRMGSSEKKQFIDLEGKPVLYHSVQLFAEIPAMEEIIVVTSPDDIERTRTLLQVFSRVEVVAGGDERQQSVYKGLQAIQHADFVLIHDAARPFASRSLIELIMSKAVEKGAVIPAIPVKDTIKMVNEAGEVISTPPRESLWAVQTPQAFRLSVILDAHKQAEKKAFLGTDDAMLLEWLGKKVEIVHGEYTNIKITTPEDLKLGMSILEQRRGQRHD